jgi:hypothetical protein
MILPSVFALGAHLLTPVADSVPTFNVEPVCRGIAIQGGTSYRDTTVAKAQQDCLSSERETRQQLLKQWPTFSVADRRHCVDEATMGGDSSYTELLTCLEMARDVRKLGSEADAPDVPDVTPREKPDGTTQQ